MIVYLLTFFTMETIVLDYSDGKVHIIRHEENLQSNDMETWLCEKYDFRLNEIEWMSVNNLSFIYHEKPEFLKWQFTITEEEIRKSTEKPISDVQMTEIISNIENDEGIWEAIEIAKREAVSYVMSKL